MLGKCEPLSHYVLVKHAVLIYRVAIDPGMGDIPAEGVSFEGAPSAFAYNGFGIYSVRSVRLHKYEVGLIAGTYETAALYLI